MIGVKQKYLPFALTTVFFWASSSVVVRVTFDSISIFNLVAVRSWLSALILLAVCLIKKIPPPRMRDVPVFFLAGVLGFGLYSTCFNTGFKYVTAATGNVVMASVPVITAIIARLIFKERIRPLGWVFIGISFSGILILMFWNGVLSINRGVFWILAAALLTSAYSLIQRRMIRNYSALQSSAYCLIAGAIVFTPFLPGALCELTVAPYDAIAVLAYTGIFAGGIGYFLWSKALSIAKRTADVTNLLYLPPFIATVLAFALYNELPDWGTAIGGAVILFSLWMYQKKA